jgi:hypothetical protein
LLKASARMVKARAALRCMAQRAIYIWSSWT